MVDLLVGEAAADRPRAARALPRGWTVLGANQIQNKIFKKYRKQENPHLVNSIILQVVHNLGPLLPADPQVPTRQEARDRVPREVVDPPFLLQLHHALWWWWWWW